MSSSSGAEGGCPGQHRDDSIIRVLDIVNTRGLHARASAKFVQTVEKYEAQVRVTRGGETVGGTSIKIEASGRQAAEVMAALERLVASRFGEDD